MITIHARNVIGIGAVRLAQSLLPELEQRWTDVDVRLILPSLGPLSHYAPRSARWQVRHTSRLAEVGKLGRLLECLTPFSASGPVLTLGDIPLRTESPQVVLFHNLTLLPSPTGKVRGDDWLKTTLFRRNSRFAARFVVQSTAVKALLTAHICENEQVVVAPIPVPSFVTTSLRASRAGGRTDAPVLVYPAAAYPHKNHQLLLRAYADTDARPFSRIILTVGQDSPRSWIENRGALGTDEMLQAYHESDALLFLSRMESFGLPLVEAMHLSLPIVCPDLPYARALCENAAIYFKDNDPVDLRRALDDLKVRLTSGWAPDWSRQLAKLPRKWSEVARTVTDTLDEVATAT